MANADELPKELGKLEITHILPQIKILDSELPVELNPFFENEIGETETKTGPKTIKFFSKSRTPYQNCRRCRYRRSSESLLDELKHGSPKTFTNLTDFTRTPTSGVLKQTLKKSTTSSGGAATKRKVLLREPVLKALQTCLHPHNNVRRKLLASAANTKATAGNDGPLTNKGISGFRDLIDECRNLLSEDVDFSGRLNQLSLSTRRNSKNFTTMQTPKTPTNHKLRKNSKFDMTTLSLPSAETIAQNEDGMSLMQQPLSSSNISSTNLQQSNISILSPEIVTNPVRSNTTCSQQAGNSAAATCDDVTIDELACYFDTLVHIPKKMSSMAEMMYI